MKSNILLLNRHRMKLYIVPGRTAQGKTMYDLYYENGTPYFLRSPSLKTAYTFCSVSRPAFG